MTRPYDGGKITRPYDGGKISRPYDGGKMRRPYDGGEMTRPYDALLIAKLFPVQASRWQADRQPTPACKTSSCIPPRAGQPRQMPPWTRQAQFNPFAALNLAARPSNKVVTSSNPCGGQTGRCAGQTGRPGQGKKFQKYRCTHCCGLGSS